MHERDTQMQKEIDELDIRKWDARFTAAHHYMMAGLAALGSGAAAASLPVALLELLPKWADLTMAVGGLATGPGAIHELTVTRKWLSEARERVAEQNEKIRKLD